VNSQASANLPAGDGSELISVIIPSFNAAQTIERCILSVLAANETDLEIIVVDDASTDHSPGLVADLVATHPDVIKLQRQEKNGGPAKARNAGAATAGGKYLFFLDSDTEMLPDALTMFRCRIAEADAVVGIYDARPLNKGWVPLYKALLNNYFFSRKGVIAYEVFDSSRAGIRTDVFRSVGGFNEALGWGMDYENEEFGYRLIESFKLILDPEIVVRHDFPRFRDLTRTYFQRVALWMEILLVRKKFESGGVTSADTGLSSASLLGAMLFALLALLSPPGNVVLLCGALSMVLFLIYLYGYFGLFAFIFRRAPWFTGPAVIMNMYFTIVIALGACLGVLRTVTGKSTAHGMRGPDVR
jgi:glycosyltransferase involved in cell wall biosynthesis